MMTAALLTASIVQTLIVGVVAWALWRVMRVLRDLHLEAQASAAERERRRLNEASGALYDAETVRTARLIVSAFDTLQPCYPCREEIDRIIDRGKLYPRQPDALKRYAKPTANP